MATDIKYLSRLSPSTVSNIRLFCEVARANGSSLSISDLLLLISLELSESELKDAWRNCESLNMKYDIDSGFVVERNEKRSKSRGAADPQAAYEETESLDRLARASSNISFAMSFGSFIGDKCFKVLAISGSTSYLSVSEDDDLDFFCISRTGSMWTSLVRSLLLARAFRLSLTGAPWLCLSYVADEEFAKSEFERNQNGVIARDALSARVIHGKEFYYNILKRSSWMKQYFPKLYSLRLMRSPGNSPDRISTEGKNAPDLQSQISSPIRKIVNLFLYYTAGSYIKLKANLLNRRFAKLGKRSSLFKLRIGPDHCIYESVDYMSLKEMYSRLEREITQSR